MLREINPWANRHEPLTGGFCDMGADKQNLSLIFQFGFGFGGADGPHFPNAKP